MHERVQYTPADEWRPRTLLFENQSIHNDRGFVLRLLPKSDPVVRVRVVRRRPADAVDVWKHCEDVGDTLQFGLIEPCTCSEQRIRGRMKAFIWVRALNILVKKGYFRKRIRLTKLSTWIFDDSSISRCRHLLIYLALWWVLVKPVNASLNFYLACFLRAILGDLRGKVCRSCRTICTFQPISARLPAIADSCVSVLCI